ncbi:MAG: Ig-like domain-containing protein [Thermoleophilia bacterium]
MSRKRRNILSAPLALLMAVSLLTTIAPPVLFANTVNTASGEASTDNAAMAAYPGSEEPRPATDATDQASGGGSPEMVSKLPQITATAPAAFASSQLITMADTTPPLITAYSPANGAVTGSSLTISASYSDPEPSVGIKPSTAMIHIDNRHQFGTIITETDITLNKTGLTDGSHKLEAFICDNNYNCTVATWNITVDATAPVISGAQPTGTVNATSATITASFSDGTGTGIDPATASVSLDGVGLNPACVTSAAGVSCASGSLGEGAHEVQVEVSDLVGNRAVKNWGFTVNTAAIAVTGQVPDDGSWQTSALPAIQATFQRAGAGIIDSSSITVLLDGTDISADAECSPDGIVYRPSSRLSEGPHTVLVTLRDDAGHTGRSEWNFTVDTIPPLIVNKTPSGTVAGAQPNISAELIEEGSGIDPDSLNLAVDGINATSLAAMTGNLVSYTPPETLTPGPHGVQLAVRDLAGNQQVSAWGFSVPQPPTPSRPSVTPLVTKQLTLVEYWQSYSSMSGAEGNWIISGFVSFPSTYYLPWYDSARTAGPFKDELVIRNQGAGGAIVNVLLGGEIKWQGKIDENGSETIQMPDTTGGPLKIICPSGQPLEVVHRVTGANGAVSETPAIAETDLESILLLPWYETRPAGEGSSSLVIANAGAEEAAVDVYVGDPDQPESLKGHYSIGPDSAARTILTDTSGGPVRIVSTNNQPLLADLRVIKQDSYSETFATGLSQLGDRFMLDTSGDGVQQSSGLHVGNGNERGLQVEVRIGEELLRDPDNPDNEYFTIPRHGARAISLNPIPGKQVEVSCTSCLFGEGIVVAESSS